MHVSHARFEDISLNHPSLLRLCDTRQEMYYSLARERERGRELRSVSVEFGVGRPISIKGPGDAVIPRLFSSFILVSCRTIIVPAHHESENLSGSESHALRGSAHGIYLNARVSCYSRIMPSRE